MHLSDSQLCWTALVAPDLASRCSKQETSSQTQGFALPHVVAAVPESWGVKRSLGLETELHVCISSEYRSRYVVCIEASSERSGVVSDDGRVGMHSVITYYC
jgi:hypothetical protein